MSGGAKKTGDTTDHKHAPRKRPRWQRSFIAACAVVVLLLLGGKLVDEASWWMRRSVAWRSSSSITCRTS